jgi:hypothetical protein
MIATSTRPMIHRPTAALMPIGRVCRAYANEVKYECLRMLRAPAFSIPFLLLPVPVYLFFGVMLAGPAVAKNPAVANYLFSGFSVFAVMGPALFGAACVLALEREAGLLKLKRALPAPGGAYLIAKMVMGMAFAGMAMIALVAAALVAGRISLTASQLLIMTMVLTIGALPFAAIGLCIGAHVSGSSAPASRTCSFSRCCGCRGCSSRCRSSSSGWRSSGPRSTSTRWRSDLRGSGSSASCLPRSPPRSSWASR